MPDAPLRFPISVRIPVAWGEMDAFQHVNNVVYARWLNRSAPIDDALRAAIAAVEADEA